MKRPSRLKVAMTATAILMLTAPPALALGPYLLSDGSLQDLSPAADGPFDHASATLRLSESRSGGHAVLQVKGLEGVEGQTFGAHLHDGPCVAGQPTIAAGHYNVTAHRGMETPVVNERTEIWLDFTVRGRSGVGTAKLQFTPEKGAHSVVIHAEPTDPTTGAAGPRLACLPAEW